MNNWIWISDEKNQNNTDFIMAEFTRRYSIKKCATLKICADAKYELYIDNELAGKGPASAGGDYPAGQEMPSMKYCYYDEYVINKQGSVEIKVIVTSVPTVLKEYTFGKPGLWVQLTENGRIIGKSDTSWQGKKCRCRTSVISSDYTLNDEACKVYELFVPQKLKKSPLEHLACEKITPRDFEKITVGRGQSIKIKYDFEKIYSAYTKIEINCNGRVRAKITAEEIDDVAKIPEEIITDKSIIHRSQRMFGVGQITLEVENIDADYCEITDLSLEYLYYPIKNEAYFESSDSGLNKIYDVCMHTLKICRQDIHLDSPTHQEPLACTGDYYIQSLMEYLNIYDPTLTAFDIFRTAEFLKYSKGVMFHTSYSLMVPMWLWDYYSYTGDKKLLVKTKKAIECLFSRFDSYISTKNNLVEKAPNYMFVDWIVMKDAPDPYGDARDMMSHGQIDGFSLHHPPKALGQSVLCMFYYEALIKGAKIYRTLNNKHRAYLLEKRAKRIKEAINTHLFDKEKGLYIGGLTTENEIENQWLPENVKRTFYLKQANVLAVLFDIAPKGQRASILEYVASDLRKEEMQPYFYHFLLEALYKEGLFEKYGFELINRYKDLVSKTDKGLCEAWEYIKCDCSHAWGGTPAYILKKAIAGFEIIEPAYKKIKLNPSLYRLEYAKFNISTPYGNIDISLQKNQKPQIVAPKEIEIIYE